MDLPVHPKRLIEVDLPIKRISAHARRERNIHQGHISSLHIWWARRPLAACRAVMLAALWPDPADPCCPPNFREDAARIVREFAGKAVANKRLASTCSAESFGRWTVVTKVGVIDPGKPDHLNVLRYALFDFIADFSNWDNSNHPEYLATARALVESAHEAVGGTPTTRPLVLDPFAGGGAIPLEALRVGADTVASDLNPVAVLLNKVVLEYIPRYGLQLAAELRRWGQSIGDAVKQELSDLFPNDPDGAIPIAYFWARTVRCLGQRQDGTACQVEIPLIRTTTLTHKEPVAHVRVERAGDNGIAISLLPGREVSSTATIRGGSATCPACGYTVPASKVKKQTSAARGGADTARLFAVLVQAEEGRRFRVPTRRDLEAIACSRAMYDDIYMHTPELIPDAQVNPLRPYKNTVGLSVITSLGIKRFVDLYTPRQLAGLVTMQKCVLKAIDKFQYPDQGLSEALVVLLNLALDRLVMQNTSLSRWNRSRSTIEGLFSKQALQVMWDFVESNPTGPAMATWKGAVDWIARVIEENSFLDRTGSAILSDARFCPVPDNSVDFYFTDPPYFAAIPYADLSDIFYIWLKKGLELILPDTFSHDIIQKENELVVTNSALGPNGESKDAGFFSRGMAAAFDHGHRLCRPGGIACIVFADSSTTSWEALLSAVLEGGWTITTSWPLDTEMQNRTRAQNSASLQSSIFLLCRPRELGTRQDASGDWRDVIEELPPRVRSWMLRLTQEGITVPTQSSPVSAPPSRSSPDTSASRRRRASMSR
jgi:putative DNA methylase